MIPGKDSATLRSGREVIHEQSSVVQSIFLLLRHKSCIVHNIYNLTCKERVQAILSSYLINAVLCPLIIPTV